MSTEQQMLAMIYIRTPLFGGLEFVRADIAERMAEAMLASIDMIDGCHDAPKNPDSLPEMVKVHLEQALSAFRSVTQDTEAGHD